MGKELLNSLSRRIRALSVPELRRPELNRSLLGDFVLLHIAIATLVGALSIGGMWWATDRVIKENQRKWATQWVERLDLLGSPLYVVPDDSEFLRIREYAESFDEIAVVRYYRPDGSLLHEELSEGYEEIEMPLLDDTDRAWLSRTGAVNPYRIDASASDESAYRISTSLWAEAILADGLMGFDPAAGGEEEATLLGFVEVGLDFSHYRAAMNRRVMQWSIGILIGILVLSVTGLVWFQRALRPLHRLRAPLSSLAQGNLEVGVDSAEHAELAAINDALASTISALHQRDREIREAANHDALTGLQGRVGLNERLKDEIQLAQESDHSSAVLFIDLDQFKYVNDSVGHGAGDRLLIRVSEHLRSMVNEEDLLCRYGGDEFVLVRPSCSASDAQLFASEILDSMAQIQFVEDWRAFNMRCSIGIAMVDRDSGPLEDVMAQADLACHEAKGQGRNRYQLFERDQGDRERIAADMGWSERIRDALDTDGLSLPYQPIVSVADGSERIYEVLLRMKGEGHRAIPPGAFLPAANRFGLMGDLDCWVIRNAFRELATVHASRPDVVFSLNLSGIVFSDPRIVDYVLEELADTQLPGTAVVFEVTEQLAIRFIEDANHIMDALMDVGCRFALDDFGTGFSSFTYLKRLPVDFLKIDGAFIENLAEDEADRAIVTSIAEIARALGTATIAEHVVNPRTLEILGEIGIEYAQGYFVGRPMASVPRRPVVTR
jgi:diguanylate cyclase (GGDEF)-like protein